MQGNGLEKESWAQLPLLVLFGPTLIERVHANNRDASEASGFYYIYLESLTLASASCRQTTVRGADSAIGIEPSL